ncbi:MAG TPA: hypothetical protein VJQ52_03340 [Steroidobacteraceae bacterium]|nr:hypothetical protein [Steroidobacteraceae bacterium]
MPIDRVLLIASTALALTAPGVLPGQTPPSPPAAVAVDQSHTRRPEKPPKKAGDCVSGARFDSFKSELDANWALSKGKADGAQLKDFPQAPNPSTDLGVWAANMAGTLRGALYRRLSNAQQQEYAALEDQHCRSRGLYCQIAFRQNAVLKLLP